MSWWLDKTPRWWHTFAIFIQRESCKSIFVSRSEGRSNLFVFLKYYLLVPASTADTIYAISTNFFLPLPQKKQSYWSYFAKSVSNSRLQFLIIYKGQRLSKELTQWFVLMLPWNERADYLYKLAKRKTKMAGKQIRQAFSIRHGFVA